MEMSAWEVWRGETMAGIEIAETNWEAIVYAMERDDFEGINPGDFRYKAVLIHHPA